ncbi:hypothetical protein AAK967_00600 [Atopobiaceae bacterium 24-176]
MAVDSNKIYVGAPDQLVTGAILMGPVMTSVPATFETALAAIEAFTGSGYVSDEGVSLSPEVSTAEIPEWGGSIVRKVVQSFSGTMTWNWIQQGPDEWRAAIGDEHVEVSEATADHGTQLHIHLGAHLPDNGCFAFKIKDGERRMLILVPNGQVTSISEMTFSASEAVKVPVELSCYDDGTGDSVHIFTDDGLRLSVPATDPGAGDE